MNPPSSTTHPDGLALAQIADDPSTNPATAAHVQNCLTCRHALADQARLVEQLHQSAPHEARARALARSAVATPARSPWGWWGPSLTAAGAAALLLLVTSPSSDSAPTVRSATDSSGSAAPAAARAANTANRPEVLVGLYQRDPAGRLAKVPATSVRPPGPLDLAVAFSALPSSKERHLVVFARQGRRVTWLKPTWTGGEPPPCHRLATEASASEATEGVTLPWSPPTAHEQVHVAALLFEGACDVADLDRRLEQGKPLPAHQPLQSWNFRGMP